MGRKAGRGRGARRRRRTDIARPYQSLPRTARCLQGAEAIDSSRQPATQPVRQGAQARAAQRTRGQRMTEIPATTAGKVTKLNRVERNAWTKRRIFDAATKIVGQYGYAEASVARITEAAGVAQGTFYNHFENRQELLDQLLPKIGIDMVRFIRERAGTPQTARQEIERFGAFFDFIREVPEFLRILNEAEFFAPIGYQKHFDNISTAYVRILKRARLAGTIDGFSDEEFEAIVHMFMGARGYLSRRYSYANGGVTADPDHVISAYEKLITSGLCGPRGEDKQQP